MIADILGTGQYLNHLAKLGMLDSCCRSLGWRLWWSCPGSPRGLSPQPNRPDGDGRSARTGARPRRGGLSAHAL